MPVMATDWVKPGEGNTVGQLWDLVINSSALHKASQEVRVNFLHHGVPTVLERQRRTRLKAWGMLELVKLTEYDIERVTAAIWEYDQPGVWQL